MSFYFRHLSRIRIAERQKWRESSRIRDLSKSERRKMPRTTWFGLKKRRGGRGERGGGERKKRAELVKDILSRKGDLSIR